eukprot:494705-Prorocentrum_minimum.AAC.2
MSDLSSTQCSILQHTPCSRRRHGEPAFPCPPSPVTLAVLAGVPPDASRLGVPAALLCQLPLRAVRTPPPFPPSLPPHPPYTTLVQRRICSPMARKLPPAPQSTSSQWILEAVLVPVR